MSAIGILYPGHSAEDDYPALESRLRAEGHDIALPVVHTSVGEDAHRVDALLDLGSGDRLAEGADRLLAQAPGVDAVVWACTSGSFVFVWDGAHEQVEALARRTGRPATSTSLAFVHACRTLGVSRVAVAASYPRDVAQAFVSLLARAGIEVSALGSHEIVTAAEVGTLGRDRVRELVAGVDASGAEAVLVPDTAMHTLGQVAQLEDELGTVVLTANQVSVHHGLALVGPVPTLPWLGTLFAGGTW
ncbi:maleate cis-trans isomerase [Ornithinimicrobium sp. LYQ92]|uniref:maleate cis-trans isomerase family protein n=1 Tax=Serinicoccus sp. LYQ92 TaxID=3378798 RepID=UPI003852935D